MNTGLILNITKGIHVIFVWMFDLVNAKQKYVDQREDSVQFIFSKNRHLFQYIFHQVNSICVPNAGELFKENQFC